jgi:hypothetical protein
MAIHQYLMTAARTTPGGSASETACSWRRRGPAGRTASVQIQPPRARRPARPRFRRATAAPRSLQASPEQTGEGHVHPPLSRQ